MSKHGADYNEQFTDPCPTCSGEGSVVKGSNVILEEIAQRIQDVYFEKGARVNIETWKGTLALLRTLIATEPTTHPSYYRTIMDSPEWKAWVKKNEDDPQWDVHESMECGWLSPEHFAAFLAHQRQQAVAEFAREVVATSLRMETARGNLKDVVTTDAIRTIAKERGIDLTN